MFAAVENMAPTSVVEPQDRSRDLLVESVVCLCGRCALGEVM